MLEVIQLLGNKDKFFKYKDYIKDNILTNETKVIFKDLEEYYNSHKTTTDITWSTFSTWFKVYHPMFKSEKHELFEQLFSKLTVGLVTNDEDTDALVNMFITRDYATRIYLESGEVAEGITPDLDAIEGLLDSYNNDIGKTTALESHVLIWNVEDIMSSVTGTGGLSWRLNSLNKTIGNIGKGDLIVLTARPNAGKTTFLSSEATHMASQLDKDKVVLWINNEEKGSKVQSKVLQSTLGLTVTAIDKDKQKAIDEYVKVLGDINKIVMVDKAIITVHEVHEAIKKYNPGLIIIDQLWKLKGFEELGEVYRQTKIFNSAREWCKEYAPVIGTIQADASAEGQMWIEMSQIYGSKTGIQGEADYIIAIGQSHDPAFTNTRFIHTPKNKASGDTVIRNLKSEVKFRPEIGRYEDF